FLHLETSGNIATENWTMTRVRCVVWACLKNIMAEPKASFLSWKYAHYFSFVEQKERNVYVRCNLCLGTKTLSAAANSNSNLLKHLGTQHATTKLVAKASGSDTGTDDTSPRAPKQQRLSSFLRGSATAIQAKVNQVIAGYIVEDMQPISTVESPAFRRIIDLIPGATRQMGRKTFSNYLESEYTKMESELKQTFEGLSYISTTADIWTGHNRSFMGVTAHWINPATLQRQKAALACKRLKGRHTYDVIASEIDQIHSLYRVSTKVTTTVTDNGSNFVKAFRVYQQEQRNDSDDDDDHDDEEIIFTDVAEILDNPTETEEGIVLPPHQRCASHTLNLISCNDIDKWLLANPGTKAVYRSSTAKCMAIWNKTSRSTVASEVVDDVLSKKLNVPCSTRWNSFYDAVSRIVEIPATDLSAITHSLQLKCLSDKELHFLKEYCATMKPLTVVLDILQGEDSCHYGTLLPALETLMSKTLEVKDSLTVATGLPEAVVEAIKVRFACVLESKDAMLAAATLPKFKLRWVKEQWKKEMIKGMLVAECHKITPENNLFFGFYISSLKPQTTLPVQVLHYLQTADTSMEILNQFPKIKEICLRKNAALPSSAPVERLFSLGSLVLSPKRNRLSDKRFEKLLLMRYNHWFVKEE
uniref:BED-type domain-containing protein n=1 Tax=Salarias fasciatus TaxID=181472 RepID=A0A672HM29_SALFA